MITAINSIRFSNNIYNNNKIARSKISSIPTDSVYFTANPLKISEKSINTVQEFANELILNKLYKFSIPKTEKFQIASIKSKDFPDKRSLIVVYREYPKNNRIKQLNFIINNNGEILENGVAVKKANEIRFYDQIIPAIINQAKKELKKA